MRKIIAILLVIACLGAGAIFLVLKRSDEHHTAERRLWKNEAIVAITNDLRDPDHIGKRFGEISMPRGGLDASGSEWLTADAIVCRDASWLAYRGQCHKQDPRIYDIFIARASDGNWYYSDYHFCKEMMLLESDGQPESLEQFVKAYNLVQFDGSSDDALRPTRNIQGGGGGRR